MENFKKIFFTIFLLFLGFFFCFNLVSALTVGGIGIRPNECEWDSKNPLTQSSFIYSLKPGAEKEGKTDIINSTDRIQKVKVYAVDATTTKEGAFAPLPADREKIEVGAWIKFKSTENKLVETLGFILEPKETKTIDFLLTVPENVWVGDHIGAIILQGTKAEKLKKELKKEEEEIEIGTAIVTRVGIRVYVNVPGKVIKELEFKEFSQKTVNKKTTFYLTLANKGNVIISLKGTIKIKNVFGKSIDKIEVPQREVFPKNTITIPVELKQKLALGRYKSSAEIIYDTEKTLSRQITFWILPPQKILIIIGLIIGGIILLLIIFLLVRRIKKKRKGKNLEKYTVSEKENIEDIAQKFDISWGKLAKINKLKPPYILNPNQEIFVPKKEEIKVKEKGLLLKKIRKLKWIIIQKFYKFYKLKRIILIFFLLIIIVGIGTIIYLYEEINSYQQKVSQLNKQISLYQQGMKQFKSEIQKKNIAEKEFKKELEEIRNDLAQEQKKVNSAQALIRMLKGETNIAILNGCRVRGISKKMKKMFEEKGIQIQFIGNAVNFDYQNTVIYYKSERLVEAEIIHNCLKNKESVILEERKEQKEDIILIIGKDNSYKD